MSEVSQDFGRWVSLVGEAPTPILDRFGGIGLVRGEFFMRRVLRSVLHDDVRKTIGAYLDSLCTAMKGRAVWYRTADLWSEEAAALEGTQYLVTEGNPIVGVRGIRRALAAPDEFAAECQVLAEVGARHDNLRVLFPFIADEHEFARAYEVARDSGVTSPIGSMVEVPSAALRAGAIADAGAAMLLVGMNDLSCLTFGRERSLGFGDKLHPAVQSLVTATVSSAHERSVPCGVAGSLSVKVIDMVQRCGADFATVHYSQARQLFWPQEEPWPEEGLELEVKLRTKEAIRRRARKASGNGQ